MSAHTARRAVAAASAALAVAGIAAPAASAKTYSPMDEQALQTSIMGDRFEILGGRLAASRGSNPLVRALGARLAKDHRKSLKESAKLARRLGISVPAKPTPSEIWEISVVAGSSGAAFDRLYSSLEVQDHKQDIMESKDEVSGGSNPAVVADARKEIPMLRTHLRLSRKALKAVS